MKRTPLNRKTPLKRTTGLKRTTRLKPMSDRAKAELKIWRKVLARREELPAEKYGFVPCEYCQVPIHETSELYCAEGHHNNHNRRDNTLENCRITHRVCNQLIEVRHIKDVPSMLGEVADGNSS